MNQIAVAIDGPSGAGKSTIARAAAARLGMIYVDTGALYRAIGLYACRKGLEKSDSVGIAAALAEITLALRHDEAGQHVLLNGEDVSRDIRLPEIAAWASAVSALGPVRAFLLDTQRQLARQNSVIMDGRDIGTVILPDAQVKIFLTASPEARARRRRLELADKGVDLALETVLEDMKKRDEADSSRALAPLKAAPDALVVDTSDLTLEESIERITQIILEKTGGRA